MKSVLVALTFSVGMSLCGWLGAVHAAPDVPSRLPDLKMDCAGIYHSSAPEFRSPPFHLYVEVYWPENLVHVSDEEGRSNIKFTIDKIHQNTENPSKTIFMSSGIVHASLNMHFKDIMIMQFTPQKTIAWSIGGRQCRIDPLG